MKRRISLTILLMLMMVGAQGQNHQYVVDSARMVIDNYLKTLNFEMVKTDSMLYIESHIISNSNPTDTTYMKRWHYPPYNYRTELWHKGKLVFGLVSNGKDVHRRYTEETKKWKDVGVSSYMDDFPGYDFHGPFANYKVMSWDIQYQGVWNFNGHEAYRIFVQAPLRYNRYYLFEKENGLLFLIDEQEEHDPDMVVKEDQRVNWRAYHEYTPVGNCLFPTIESYQTDNGTTIIYHHVKYQTVNLTIFQK